MPKALVAVYKRGYRWMLIPNREALLGQASAFAYTLYGDYAAARATLKSVNWDRCIPMFRPGARWVAALVCYLETADYVKGLELARSARDMGQVASVFPGARSSAAALDYLVEIGEILCGDCSNETIASLERKRAALPTLGKLVIAWWLAVAHDKRGDHAKAETARNFIRDVAPHCRGIASSPNNQSA